MPSAISRFGLTFYLYQNANGFTVAKKETSHSARRILSSVITGVKIAFCTENCSHTCCLSIYIVYIYIHEWSYETRVIGYFIFYFFFKGGRDREEKNRLQLRRCAWKVLIIAYYSWFLPIYYSKKFTLVFVSRMNREEIPIIREITDWRGRELPVAHI